MTREKIQNIQSLRGVAALSVVLFHLVIIEKKYGGSTPLLHCLFQFGMWGVDLFFVISGFVMITVARNKFKVHRQAFVFLYRRVSRIYPAYWFYSILVLFVFLISPGWVNSSQGEPMNILASFLLFPSDQLPLLMVGWTLIHEIYFYLVFFFILILCPERHAPRILFIWGLIVLLLNVGLNFNHPALNVMFHPMTLEFIGGCFIALIYFQTPGRASARPLIFTAGLAILLSLTGYGCYHAITGHIEPQHWWRVLIFGAPAMVIVFCLTHAERKGWTAHWSLVRLGDASYSIYLSHLLTLSAMGRLWQPFSLDSIYDNAVMIPVLFITSIALGMISYQWMERPLLKFCRRLA